LPGNVGIESRAFGFLFISIAIAVLSGTIINEFLASHHIPLYYQLLSWILVFIFVLGIAFTKMKNLFRSIRNRMKNSIRWPLHIKIINGLSWAGPFLAIPIFHPIAHYLILLGIGAGNISTFFLIKRYSKYDNKEQFIVGILAIIMIPVLFLIDVLLAPVIVHQHVLTLSRIFVAISYGIGGIYALNEK
jgi:formate-dependent nitrite reductase membrane component NrfD